MKQTSSLLWAFSIGIIAHIAFLLVLNQSSFLHSSYHFQSRVDTQRDIEAWKERMKRGELLAEIFHVMASAPVEVKKQLTELKTEYAPVIEPFLPQELAFSPEESEFDFENVFEIEAGGGEWENILNQGEFNASTLLHQMPSKSFNKLPPFAPFGYSQELYNDRGVIASSEHFDIQVEYAPKRLRPGYVFKITLIPHDDIQFKRIRQNFYFLLDRSNSIPRARYAFNKKAVAESLAYLRPGDRFNILVFDHRVVRFREQVVECSEETLQAAYEFLDKQGHGGYFAATELYASLDKIIPADVAENEINNAILLSDGDTYLTQEKQRLTIGGWTAKNKGKVALYAVTSGTDNNLALLELLSAFNKGGLIYAQEHQNIGHRLSYLMQMLQKPIGKDIVATPATEDRSMNVILQPKRSRIPHLYQNRPFVIYGSTNKLSDFYLFIQGKYYDYPFDIKKKVSFDTARLDTYSVERGWTQLVAQEFYERYFEEGNATHLEAVKQLLSPLNLPMPLID